MRKDRESRPFEYRSNLSDTEAYRATPPEERQRLQFKCLCLETMSYVYTVENLMSALALLSYVSYMLAIERLTSHNEEEGRVTGIRGPGPCAFFEVRQFLW